MTKKKDKYSFDIAIVGGLGHVGLPLGLAFADKGLKVCLYDLDEKKAETVTKGIMPFIEYDAEPILKKVIENDNLEVSLDIKSVSNAKTLLLR